MNSGFIIDCLFRAWQRIYSWEYIMSEICTVDALMYESDMLDLFA